MEDSGPPVFGYEEEVRMGFYEFERNRPEVKENSFVHPQATMMDSVTIGEGCHVGAGAVLQRDWGYILIVPGSDVWENRLVLADTDIPGGKMVLGPQAGSIVMSLRSRRLPGIWA